MRKRYDGKIRAKVALEAVKGDKTLAKLSSEFNVHTNQICTWRKQLLECLTDLYTDQRKKKDKDTEELISELYRQIGQMKVELSWLKNNLKRSCKKEEAAIEVTALQRGCERWEL